MSKIVEAMRVEIRRVVRKELQAENGPLTAQIRQLKKTVSAQRQAIAILERRLGKVEKGKPSAAVVAVEEGADTSGARLSPILIRKLRKRLGLNQSDFALLLGVSSQAVAAWEQDRTKPRAQTKAAIIALREKKPEEVQALLEAAAK
jgi:DNA-binding transcriptional regulator YiaG